MPLGGLTASNASIQNRAAELKRIIRSMQIARRMLLQAKEKASITLCGRSKWTGRRQKIVMRTIGRHPAAAAFPVVRAWSKSSITPDTRAIHRQKVPFEEIADARIAREVAKELGYKVD